MDAPRRTRQVDRERSGRNWQAQRGARQIVIPRTREQYDQYWGDPQMTRELVDQILVEHPELFPPEMSQAYALHGFGRPSQKLDGVKLRKVRLPGGAAY